MADITKACGIFALEDIGLWGTDAAGALSTVSGFCTVKSHEGIDSIEINGITPIVEGSIVPGYDGARGDLQIDGITEEPEFSGHWVIAYTYSLKENVLHEVPVGSEFFSITVTDDNGEATCASLQIDITDDVLALYRVDNVDEDSATDLLSAEPGAWTTFFSATGRRTRTALPSRTRMMASLPAPTAARSVAVRLWQCMKSSTVPIWPQ